MAAPIIAPLPTSPDPANGGTQFDADAAAWAFALAVWTTQVQALGDFCDVKAGEALAAALGGSLPPLTGHALELLRVNAGETAAEFVALASAAQIRANTAGAILSMDGCYAALADVALADQAVTPCALSGGTDFTWNTAGNRTINFTDLVPKKKGVIAVTQDFTGSRTLSAQVDGGTGAILGTVPVLTTTGQATDLVGYWVKSATEVYLWMIEAEV